MKILRIIGKNIAFFEKNKKYNVIVQSMDRLKQLTKKNHK